MRNADRPAITAIVAEMLGSREVVLNEEMARAVSDRLGIRVSRSEISGLRTEMGVNTYQLSERDGERALREGVEALRRDLAAQGVGEAPWAVLAALVALRWDNADLAARNRELAGEVARLKDALARARRP